MFFRQKKSKSIASLLLSAALLAAIFVSLFTLHIHITADGRIVVHGHAMPGQTDSASHSHDALQLYASQSFFNQFESPLALAIAVSLVLAWTGSIVSEPRLFFSSIFHSYFNLRAPPIFAD